MYNNVELRQLTRGQERSQAMAIELGRLIVSTSDDSFEELHPKFLALQRRLIASAFSPLERREIRRRIAEEFVNAAFGRNCPWPVFGRTLRRIQRLGYTDVERRYHIAALYALWSRAHPEHSCKARRLLDEAERRLLRLPRGHLHRRELLAQLPELRARAGLPSRSDPPH